MDQARSLINRIEVDVVVIGGGIQGLWLLGNLIEAGYNAILLERMQPGFGQTGHSHVFLHQGHMYAGMPREDPNDSLDRINYVQQANSLWQRELQSGRLRGLQPIGSTFYMAFRDAENGEKFQNLCMRGSLTCDPLDTQDIPADFGPVERAYKANGTCLDSNRLLNHLLQSDNLTDRVALCEIVSVESDSSGRFRLQGKRDKRKRDPKNSLEIDASAVILSAGSGNEHMQGLFGLDAATNGSRQQTVKTFMLIVRELNKSLLPFTGMHPDFDGLFLVSRRDGEGRTVWLIGDKQRELVAVPGEITAFDPVSWFKNTRLTIEKLFPSLMSNPDDYEWGIYEASKAEPWTEKGTGAGRFPGSYHFKRASGLPVWLVWPTLLTFAPLAAQFIVQDLETVVTPNSAATDWGVWRNFRVPLTPDECRWKITPLLSWKDFKRCYAP